MKALSILQPWASLCVTTDPKTGKAYKQIKTSSRNTKHRGPLLIHASKKWDRELNDTVGQIGADGILKLHGYHSEGIVNGKLKTNLPLGDIIGMVNVEGTFETVPMKPLNYFIEENGKRWELTKQEYAFGDYSAGRYGWLLSDPILFKTPIPCKGSLSIWNLPGELEEAVQEQISMATAPSVLLATPGEGAVIVDGVKNHSCGTCKHNEKEVTQFPCDRCTPVIYDCWEPMPLPESKLHLPYRGVDGHDGLMDDLRKSEIN